MKCNECEVEIEGDLKYLAYNIEGKPVQWKLCENCRNKWLKYRKDKSLLTDIFAPYF